MAHIDQHKRIHLIGIGGCSMSGLAQILRARGYAVQGSDKTASPFTQRLKEQGIPVTIGHGAENLGDADLVIYSAAIQPDNVERAAAHERGIPEIERSVALGQLTEGYKEVAGIAGCHGKTTITSMLALISESGGMDATVHVGGHTVDDTEPKFGLAVTGIVHPDRVLTNASARPGDALVLTKPIGTGILATAVKRGLAGEDAARRTVAVMRTLNRSAAEAMLETGVSACTDVTGFGLLGHLREMAAASGLDAEVEAVSVPLIEGTLELAAADAVPGGTLENLAHVSPHVDFAPDLSRVDRLLLADAQTSGGLLIAVPAARCEVLLASLRQRGVDAARRIGRFTKAGPGRIRVG